eukprot:jgi/Chlat1/9176/Chrsp97S08456
MALRGVWQLRSLAVNYCSHSGSSKGARVFVRDLLPAFVEANPQLEVSTNVLSGRHPHLVASYVIGRERVVDVKNQSPDEILQHATLLRDSLGRKVLKLRSRQVTRQESIQGRWHPGISL